MKMIDFPKSKIICSIALPLTVKTPPVVPLTQGTTKLPSPKGGFLKSGRYY
jgi:hypothetical protein